MQFRTDDCLEKMNSRDKDFRYMAVLDLMNELPKGLKLDAESEKKIINKLLDLVAKDGSGDVKALAVKCLGSLAPQAQETQVQTMIDKLGNFLLDDDMVDEIRDISSIGLKTVVGEIPDTQVNTIKLIVKSLATRLVDIIARGTKPEVVLLCLDLLNDLLARWGKEMAKQKGLFQKIQKSVIPQLTVPQSANRKKAIGCLAHLSVSSPDDLFAELIDFFVKSVQSSKKADHIRTFIQGIGAVSRQVGFRLGKQLELVVPILFKFTESSQYEEDAEIRENCLQAYESVILRCPKESEPYLDKIEDICLKLISYDPNYVDDDEDGGDMEVDGDEEFEGEDFGDENISDDDMSWKIRKASTRCLAAIIRTRPARLPLFYEKVCPTLVKRFKEREENVKLDVFNTFIDVLRQTAIVTGADREGGSAGQSTEFTLHTDLKLHVPSVVKEISKELKGKSLKTKPGAFQVLIELFTVLPGCISSEHVGDLVPGIEAALSDKTSNSTLKIEALVFLRVLLQTHSPNVVAKHLKKITDPVYKAVGDRYYKITAEGLRVCTQIARVLPSVGFDYASFVPPLYQTMLERLKKLDIDQEVKEVAIECAGVILSILGDKIVGNIPECLGILVERLNNEVTRLYTVRCFESIASSTAYTVNLDSVLVDIFKSLSSFLRKHNRQLKQATLSSVGSLLRKYGSSRVLETSGPVLEELLKELAGCTGEQDLHLSHLALSAVAAALHSNRGVASGVQTYVIPKCHELLKSSLLQGLALESMLSLYTELVSTSIPFDNLVSGLIQVTKDENLSKQSYHSIAQCIGVLVAGHEGRSHIVDRFINDIKSAKKNSNKLLPLYCLAEIGRRVDLSENVQVKDIILSSLDSPTEELKTSSSSVQDSSYEEVKTAASVALGCAAVGNLTYFLPEILQGIEAHPKRQYLLLGSLREVIVRLSQSSKGIQNLSRFFDALLTLLFSHTHVEDEGTRKVVAECLGKLALLEPVKVVGGLSELVSHSSPFTRACVTTAIKSIVSDKSHPADKVLEEHVAQFLNLLSDKDLVVRKAALLSLNHLAHHKPKTIREHLHKYLPLLYGETVVKKELIREVDLGPFKHKVDDGIELRQAAFEAMYTLLDTCITQLDLHEFIAQLASGLVDVYDVQMLNHLLLIRLAKKAGASLIAGLDPLMEPLKLNVLSKPKDSAVKQQVERNDELIRSSLRAIAAISRIPEAETSPKFQDFMKSTVQQAGVIEKYEVILKEQADK